MTMEDDAPLASTRMPRRPRWPRTAVAVGSLAVAGAGLLASTELHGIPSPHATPQAARAPVGASIVLADDAPPALAPPLQPAPASAATLPPGSPFIGAFQGSPESRLIGIYRAIGQQRTDLAIDAAASLTHDVPSFRLAQLVYADLLSARIGRTAAFGAAPAASGGDRAVAEEVGELRDEAVQRLHALQERPPANRVPAEFIVLPRAIHHAIAVDTTRSRLYLFENGPQGVRLVSDHYVSVGKQGVDKSVEGDERTPLGVYFVSDRVGQGSSLGPAFGAGAMQLNYPNLFDKLHGRSGSGIYVHGVPFSTYSRPPRDSDGCVTLANDELVMLMNTVPLHDTPVIITRSIHWVDDNAAQARRAGILEAVDRWQSVRARDDVATLNTFYEPGAAPPTPAAPPSPPPPPVATIHGKRRAVPPPAVPLPDPVSFDNLSVMTWSDAKETMVVTFSERGLRTHRETVLRQYWERDAARWKIVAEGTVR